MEPTEPLNDLVNGTRDQSYSYPVPSSEQTINSTPQDGSIMHSPAIVGLACRFPQEATTPESLWSMLMKRRCATTEFPPNRMNINAFYHPDKNRRDTIPFKGGHFLSGDIGAFDAQFFSITPMEAADMDPMQRGLLETTYHALENAGISLEAIAGTRTSVYVGCLTNDYDTLYCKDPLQPGRYAATGLSSSMLSNRISWFFDLRGASITIDTACSGSLTALDLAFQDLRSGKSSTSIVAGCNLMYSPEMFSSMSNMSFLSEDSRCFSFDHRANGYARGEGFGVVVLRRIQDAIEGGDTIRAVIRATGTNQDGRTAGITQPSKNAQEELIKETYEKAGLSMQTTRYFEAHGTGTKIGDPIEANAIGAAFKSHRRPSDPLFVGALKSNIGHLEGASGVAAIIKTVLALEKGIIPPNANFECLNPAIDAQHLCLEFPDTAQSWPAHGPRRASINSFGFGGSNAHVILDDANSFLREYGLVGHHCTTIPAIPLYGESINGVPAGTKDVNGTVSGRTLLLVWSAADEKSLRRKEEEYISHVNALCLSNGDYKRYTYSLAYTLAERRTRFPLRSFQVLRPESDSTPHTGTQLQVKPTRALKDPKLCYIFTGQGAQWPKMGRELFQFSVFRQSLQEAETYITDLGAAWSLTDEMFRPKCNSGIHDPRLAQPLCTVLQIALVDLLRSLNVKPAAVTGHSSGEIAAAYCAGAISRRSAWRIAYFRGSVAALLVESGKHKGAMLSVGLSAAETEAHITRSPNISNSVSIACINSPQNVTVSGNEDCIDRLKHELDLGDTFARKLNVSVAYHSTHMSDVASQYRSHLMKLEKGDNNCSSPIMISSVTGKEISVNDLCHGEYWVANMVSPVLFSEALSVLLRRSTSSSQRKIDLSHRRTFSIANVIEIGPHSALRGPVRDIMKSFSRASDSFYLSTLTRYKSSIETLMEALGNLYCLGYPVDIWKANQSAFGETPRVLTDLPEYPFDHSKSYWTESRASREFRLRDAPRLDLLGTPTPGSSYLDRRWRHKVCLSEMPWLSDHKISSAILYPAAGMLVMAIEAARQASNTPQTITGFSIREVSFSKAMLIDSGGNSVETEFCLREASRRSWAEFDLSAFEDGNWSRICHGFIRTDHHPQNGIASTETLPIHTQRMNELVKVSQTVHSDPQEASYLYKQLKEIGLEYGSDFQRLDQIRLGLYNTATALLHLFEWKTQDDTNHHQPHVIHPASLDGVFQLAFAPLLSQKQRSGRAFLPTKLDRLWLSNSGLCYDEAHTLKLTAGVEPEGHGKSAAIIGLDSANGAPKLLIDGVSLSPIATNTAVNEDGDGNDKQLCLQIRSLPDISLLTSTQLLHYCGGTNAPNEEASTFWQDLQYVLRVFMCRTLKSLDGKPLGDFKPHIRKYIGWMKRELGKSLPDLSCQLLIQRAPELIDDVRHREVADRLQCTNEEGRFYVTTGYKLREIVNGDIDALSFLWGQNLAEDYYRYITANSGFLEPFMRYLSLLSHKKPCMRILELGAGTGSTTAHVLNALHHGLSDEASAPHYSQYVFTDISESFFRPAQERFTDYTRLEYRTLDIEKDLVEQGFTDADYDLVIAAGVLHVTQNLSNVLQNVRRLLKPGGQFALIELTQPEKLGSGFVFGLLPGWWDGTNNDPTTDCTRVWSPCIDTDSWNKLAMASGFSAPNLSLDDSSDRLSKETSLLVYTASEATNGPTLPREQIGIIIAHDNKLHIALARELQSHLNASRNAKCEISSLENIANANEEDHTSYISLLEIDGHMIETFNHEDYASFHALIKRRVPILWLLRASPHQDNFTTGAVYGLVRTLRIEDPTLSFVILNLDGQTESNEIIEAASSIYARAMSSCTDGKGTYEPEYTIRNGLPHIPRLIESRPPNDHLALQTSEHHESPQNFENSPPVSLDIDVPGSLDTLKLYEDVSTKSQLPSHEVEIQVQAAGVNFFDVLGALGNSAITAPLGIECAGVVRRSGDQSKFKPGDRVVAAYVRGFKTFIYAPDECVALIPDALSFPEAAAIPVAFTTAHHALRTIANMQPDEKVLIHSGAGGTGQAAIQVALEIGAEVFTTVGSEEKKQHLISTYGVLPDHVLYSRDTSFLAALKQLTNGYGVDVVLNSLPADRLLASLECLAPHGRFLELGKADIYAYEQLPMYLLRRNVTLSCIDMATFPTSHPKLLNRTLQAVMSGVRDGKLQPPQPLKTFPLSQAEQAFRTLQNSDNIGKVVLEMQGADMITPMIRPRHNSEFSANATYVLSGGLGGLGQAIAQWMVTRGARNFILLSRRGVRSEHQEFQERMKRQGVQIAAPACDICDIDRLKETLDECLQSMPAIRGCMQATADLRDGFFEQMPFDDWNGGIRSRARGSWNLHQVLPPDVDFFIMLSSLIGIVGRETTSNYAAGSTYMDALAYHRLQRGQKAISIDLGIMEEFGMLANDAHLMASLKAPGTFRPLLPSQLFALLDYYCNPRLELPPSPDIDSSQLIVGLESPATVQAKGLPLPPWIHQPIYSHLFNLDHHQDLNKTSSEATAIVDFSTAFRTVSSLSAAGLLVAEALMTKLSSIIATPLEDIDVDSPMHRYGVDSLLAVEIRNWFSSVVKADVTVFDVLGETTFRAIGTMAAGRSRWRKEEWMD